MTEPVIEGDPFGKIKDSRKDNVPSARQVNEVHTKADTDSGNTAIHHTLGIDHNQASAGDHSHDGITSRKVGAGQKLTCATLAGPDATRIQNILLMLHKIVDFTEV